MYLEILIQDDPEMAFDEWQQHVYDVLSDTPLKGQFLITDGGEDYS